MKLCLISFTSTITILFLLPSSSDSQCSNKLTKPVKLNVTSDNIGGLEAHDIRCPTHYVLSGFGEKWKEEHHWYEFTCCSGSTKSCGTESRSQSFTGRIDLDKLSTLDVACQNESVLSEFKLRKNNWGETFYSYICCQDQNIRNCRSVESSEVDYSHKKQGPHHTISEYLSKLEVSCNKTEALKHFSINFIGKMAKYSYECCETNFEEKDLSSPFLYLVPVGAAIFGSITVILLYGGCRHRFGCRKTPVQENIAMTTLDDRRNLLDPQQQAVNAVNPNENEYVPLLNDTVMQIDFDESLIIHSSRLTIVSQIGCGAFGVVEKAELRPGSHLRQTRSSKSIFVAVKRPLNPKDEQQRTSLEGEAKLLTQIRNHENVINLIGIVSETNKFEIVLEYCEGGSLKTFLNRNRNNAITNNVGLPGKEVSKRLLVSFGQQVAEGMTFLHTKRCVHRDLAARNILLSKYNSVAKITDFGLARDIYSDGIYNASAERKIPWPWYAPEYLRNLYYVLESDIWSFGVLLWEIMKLGERPYIGINFDTNFVGKIEQGFRLSKPPEADERLYKIMTNCWQLEPSNRPPFSTLRKELAIWLDNQPDH